MAPDLCYNTNKIWRMVEILSYIVPAICAIVAVYHNRKLYLNQDETFVQKRSFKLTLCMNIWIIFTIIATALSEISFLYSSKSSWKQMISYNIYLVSWWLIFYFLITKSWSLYFKYYWTFYTAESEWRHIINPDIDRNIDNGKINLLKVLCCNKMKNGKWFIRNNHKYGNIRYCAKLFGSFCVTGICISLFSEILFLSLANHSHEMFGVSLICLAITISPAIIFYCILVLKTPYIKDPFYIHWESKIHSRILLLMAMTLITMKVITISVDYCNMMIVADIILEILLFAMNYVSTIMIIKKAFSSSNPKSKQAITNFNTASPIRPKLIAFGSSSPSTPQSENDLSWILSGPETLHNFMSHLSKEYSLECLLSLIEMVQFQQYVGRYMNKNNNTLEIATDDIQDTNNCELGTDFEFASNVPLSVIIQGEEIIPEEYNDNEIMYCVKVKAHKIYNKYVKVGCEYEINIAGAERSSIEDILGDLDKLIEFDVSFEDMYHIFVNIQREMILLLQFSLNRMRAEPLYPELSPFSSNDSTQQY